MRSITPPEHEFHHYLSAYQLITQILPKYIFSANVQKKQQFVRSLGNAQRPLGI